MKPISPVVPGLEPYEINFGAGQEQYEPLPALRSNKANSYRVISRWQPTDDERKAIAAGDDIYVTQLTFGHLYQPTSLVVAGNQASFAEETKETLGLDEELNERLKT